MDAGLSQSIKPWTLSWLERGCSVLRMHETMDVIMPPTWMLSCQIASDHGSHPGRAQNAIQHGRYHCPTPRMLPCQIAADHGRYDGWALIALCSECNIPWTLSCPPPTPCMDALVSECIRPWTLSCSGHGCSGLRRLWTMDVMARLRMYWTMSVSWFGHGCSLLTTPALQFLICPGF